MDLYEAIDIIDESKTRPVSQINMCEAIETISEESKRRNCSHKYIRTSTHVSKCSKCGHCKLQ